MQQDISFVFATMYMLFQLLQLAFARNFSSTFNRLFRPFSARSCPQFKNNDMTSVHLFYLSGSNNRNQLQTKMFVDKLQNLINAIPRSPLEQVKTILQEQVNIYMRH